MIERKFKPGHDITIDLKLKNLKRMYGVTCWQISTTSKVATTCFKASSHGMFEMFNPCLLPHHQSCKPNNLVTKPVKGSIRLNNIIWVIQEFRMSYQPNYMKEYNFAPDYSIYDSKRQQYLSMWKYGKSLGISGVLNDNIVMLWCLIFIKHISNSVVISSD